MSSPTKSSDPTTPTKAPSGSKSGTPKQAGLKPPPAHLPPQKPSISTQSSTVSELALGSPAQTAKKAPGTPKSTTPPGEPGKKSNYRLPSVETGSPSPPKVSTEMAGEDRNLGWMD